MNPSQLLSMHPRSIGERKPPSGAPPFLISILGMFLIEPGVLTAVDGLRLRCDAPFGSYIWFFDVPAKVFAHLFFEVYVCVEFAASVFWPTVC